MVLAFFSRQAKKRVFEKFFPTAVTVSFLFRSCLSSVQWNSSPSLLPPPLVSLHHIANNSRLHSIYLSIRCGSLCPGDGITFLRIAAVSSGEKKLHTLSPHYKAGSDDDEVDQQDRFERRILKRLLAKKLFRDETFNDVLPEPPASLPF